MSRGLAGARRPAAGTRRRARGGGRRGRGGGGGSGRRPRGGAGGGAAGKDTETRTQRHSAQLRAHRQTHGHRRAATRSGPGTTPPQISPPGLVAAPGPGPPPPRDVPPRAGGHPSSQPQYAGLETPQGAAPRAKHPPGPALPYVPWDLSPFSSWRPGPLVLGPALLGRRAPGGVLVVPRQPGASSARIWLESSGLWFVFCVFLYARS